MRKEHYFAYEALRGKEELIEFISKEESREITSAHFLPSKTKPEKFNIGDLTEEDFIIWHRIHENTITKEEFSRYDLSLMESTKRKTAKRTTSRMVFIAAARNRVMSIFYENDKH